jgi:1,4-alpha-glucan branching enzyme
MPVSEYPYDPSWGYQVTSYFAPTSRFGSPDDFRYLIDHLHSLGIGVILDWVPAHFPKDEWALARLDGTCLYEHEDPRLGEHPDWGTLIFNYSRNEVRNFLVASALYWLESFHIDGLRVDAVASMLYLDYSRKEGEWIANEFGGRENLAAVKFLQEATATAYKRFPGILMIAEESTAWAGVTKPTSENGLGFGFKWNMGWMHDSLQYLSHDPIHRLYHHNEITFSILYAFSENFLLPLSHDEVVHGKGSLITKMPGDGWQKFANLRAYTAFMFTHPGKKLNFMGNEFAQGREWSHERSLDWHLLEIDPHQGQQHLTRDLNHLYQNCRALQLDHSHEGFEWLCHDDASNSIVAFLRKSKDQQDLVLVVVNFTPVPQGNYRVGVPVEGTFDLLLNTDNSDYTGSNFPIPTQLTTQKITSHGKPFSLEVAIPPLAAVVFHYQTNESLKEAIA